MDRQTDLSRHSYKHSILLQVKSCYGRKIFTIQAQGARMFVTVSHLHPSLIFASKAGAYQCDPHFLREI